MALPERLQGALTGLGAAVAFGVVVVVQRSLAVDDLPVATVVGGRYGIAAVLLFGVLLLTGRPLRPVPGERLRAAALGLCGYIVHSSLFYVALQHGTAGAVAMLFYLYPAVVVLLEMAARLRAVALGPLGAPLLSGAGVAVLLAWGERLEIDPLGIGLALAAAVAVSIYLIASSRLIRHTAPIVTAAWVAAGVATSMLTAGRLLQGFTLPAAAVPRLLLAGVGSAVATTLVYATLARLGAGPTAVFMTMQALVAALLAALLLAEPLTLAHLIGGVALLGGAALASGGKGRERPAALTGSRPPPS